MPPFIIYCLRYVVIVVHDVMSDEEDAWYWRKRVSHGLDKGDHANYWPITSLCTFSMVLEKLSLELMELHWTGCVHLSPVGHDPLSLVFSSESAPTAFCTSGILQGSILGPLLFSMYILPVSDVIACHDLQHRQYANDLQVCLALRPGAFANMQRVSLCVQDVSRWYMEN